MADRARFAIDELGAARHNVVCPAFLNSTELEAARRDAAIVHGKVLTVGDTGAAVHVCVDRSYAVPGSIRSNSLAVSTANGTVVPPECCDVRKTLRCSVAACPWSDVCCVWTPPPQYFCNGTNRSRR